MFSDHGYAGILADAAARWPDRTAVRFEGDAWTYGELQSAVLRAASRLADEGIGAGTRVALLVENCPGYLVAQFALAHVGAVFVSPNPYWTAAETAQALQVSGTAVAIRAEQAVPAAIDHVIAIESLLSGSTPHLEHAAHHDATALRYIPFSSGTTGLPKGVLHTDASLCGAVQQLRHHLALSTTDRLQIALPLCHIFGATMSAAAISVGAPVTLFRRFDLEESLRHAIDTGVTIWPIAGAVAYQLAQRTDLAESDFRALRFFMWGGSAVPVALARRITEATGVGFLCSYGMTEAMMAAFNPVDSRSDWRLDSPGFATTGTELRLSDRNELEVRGPSVAAGYAGIDSPAFQPDGWFRTGDLATIADDGRLTIVDRIKDMLKVSGFQVSPIEVEQALMTHPAVEDVAVAGGPDEQRGEVPVAFVVARTPVTAEQLAEYLRPRLAGYKRPAEYRFVAALPRTSGGKLRRAVLRNQLRG